MNRVVRCFLLIATAGCEGQLVVPSTPPQVKRLTGTLLDGALAERTELTLAASGVGLATLSGRLAVATSSTVESLAETGLAPLAVGAPDEDSSLGTVTGVFRRGTSGLWVASSRGLFHDAPDAPGHLLRSPASDSLGGRTVRALDAWGSGASEELWLLTEQGLVQLARGHLTPVSLSFPVKGELGLPTTVVAVGPGRAVMTAGADAFLVDLEASTATWLADGLGEAKSSTRADDGTALLATTEGVLRRLPTGAVELVTLGGPIDDVWAGGGAVTVVTQGAVAQLEGEQARRRGPVSSARPRGAVMDAAGNTFVLDGAGLAKLATGADDVPSFATDVKPFFVAHCVSCHQATHPVIDFISYDTAVAKAAATVARLRETTSPMPPANTEVLVPSQYAVVLRWVEGGLKP